MFLPAPAAGRHGRSDVQERMLVVLARSSRNCTIFYVFISSCNGTVGQSRPPANVRDWPTVPLLLLMDTYNVVQLSELRVSTTSTLLHIAAAMPPSSRSRQKHGHEEAHR